MPLDTACAYYTVIDFTTTDYGPSHVSLRARRRGFGATIYRGTLKYRGGVAEYGGEVTPTGALVRCRASASGTEACWGGGLEPERRPVCLR